MNKIAILLFGAISLLGCGESNESDNSSIKNSAVSLNTALPRVVTGTVDIIDSGVGDSDYADWAIGTITVGDEDISITFDASVLEQAGIDLDFNFSDPATIELGEPEGQDGDLTYPVKKIM
ncbi:hypothetical protein [Parathalassolituus penaei]|uniref:Uncharacterized protein n=1 Tax=Parathalassolituus penaei TaxID=2997323 RepID=A0A9X3EFH1_9GAMM|nr:hypothetical protein [Parathalassolituus penaei]MCY0966285.1 hypothetical protein [Parathalassolituus penaei]